jgi:hypothetical protein
MHLARFSLILTCTKYDENIGIKSLYVELHQFYNKTVVTEAINCIKPYDFCEGWDGYEKSLNASTIVHSSQKNYNPDWFSAVYSHRRGGMHDLVDEFFTNDEQLEKIFTAEEPE